MASQPGSSARDGGSTDGTQTGAQNPLNSLHAAALSDIGLRREENQDSLGTVENEHFRFFMVADGMGGVKGGAIASGLAIHVIKEAFHNATVIDEKSLITAVQNANKRIFEEALTKPALTGMGTTFVGLAFSGTDVIVTSVGDSRAYRVRDGQVAQLTEDHTLVMELLRSGTISAEQAHNHPVSHMLTRSLGPAPEVEVDCFRTAEKPHPGDVYLLCSDGLYNLVGEAEIGEILSSQELEAAVETLIDLANERGGTDNITVIAIELGDAYPLPAEAAASSDKGAPETFIPLASKEEALAMAKSATQSRPAAAAQIPPVEPPPQSVPPPPQNTAAETRPTESAASENPHEPEKDNAAAQPIPPAAPVTEEKISAEDIQEAPVEMEGGVVEEAPQEPWSRGSAAIVSTSSRSFLGFGVVALALFVGIALGRLVLHSEHAPVQPQEVEPLPRIAVQRATPAPTSALNVQSTQSKAPLLIDTHPETRLVEPHTFPGDEHSSAGLTGEQISRIRLRQKNLTLKIQNLNNKIDSFDKPFSGDLGRSLTDAEARIENYQRELDEVKKKVDIATRRLAIWYQRRKQLKETDPINLAAQVALSSEAVRQKHEAFKEATANYIREAEILLLNPADQKQSQKVAELATVRKQRIGQLAAEIRNAIDDEISNADQFVAELALERDKVELNLQNSRRDVAYMKTLVSTDASAKSKVREDLRRERDGAQAELDSLLQLLPMNPPSAREDYQLDPAASG